MSASPTQTEKGIARASTAEIKEYTRILRMLDQQQQMNISAHLYSAYLMSKSKHIDLTGRVKKGRIPRDWWVAWPLKNAPAPRIIDDSFPDDTPRIVSNNVIERVQRNYTRNSSDVDTDIVSSRRALLNACEETLQRHIYKQIHEDKRADLEPVLEPEPTIDGGLEDWLFSTVDKYVTRTNGRKFLSQKGGVISWDQLNIQGPAKERLDRLFKTDYVKHIVTGESDEEVLDDEYNEDNDTNTDSKANTDRYGDSDNANNKTNITELNNESSSSESESSPSESTDTSEWSETDSESEKDE